MLLKRKPTITPNHEKNFSFQLGPDQSFKITHSDLSLNLSPSPLNSPTLPSHNTVSESPSDGGVTYRQLLEQGRQTTTLLGTNPSQRNNQSKAVSESVTSDIENKERKKK